MHAKPTTDSKALEQAGCRCDFCRQNFPAESEGVTIELYRSPQSRAAQRFVTIDPADLPLIQGRRWCQMRTKLRNEAGELLDTYVAFACVQRNRRSMKLLLHRLLLDAGNGQRVLH